MAAFIVGCPQGSFIQRSTTVQCQATPKWTMRLGFNKKNSNIPGGFNFGKKHKGNDGLSGGGSGSGGSGFGNNNIGGGRGGDGTFGAADRGGNPFERTYAWYLGWLRTRPLVTKMLTSFVGFFLADLLLQSVRGGRDASKTNLENMFVFGMGDISLVGALQTAVFGSIFHALVGHYYYTQLESVLTGGRITQLLGKTLADTLIWPPFLVATRLAYNKLLKGGKDFGSWWGEVKNSRLTGNLLLWLPLSFLNFKFVATPERILWHNLVLIGLCGMKKFFGVDFMP